MLGVSRDNNDLADVINDVTVSRPTYMVAVDNHVLWVRLTIRQTQKKKF